MKFERIQMNAKNTKTKKHMWNKRELRRSQGNSIDLDGIDKNLCDLKTIQEYFKNSLNPLTSKWIKKNSI